MNIYIRIRNWIANLLGYRQETVYRDGVPIGVRDGFNLIRRDTIATEDHFRVIGIAVSKPGEEFIIFVEWAEPPLDLTPIFLLRVEDNDLNLYQVCDLANLHVDLNPLMKMDNIPSFGDVIKIDIKDYSRNIEEEKNNDG